ncbi:MAG TPA: protein kinase [Solirubrobacteraceae bacterium]|nr:protein kinase [Solirubrobacteraceae bacterium]
MTHGPARSGQVVATYEVGRCIGRGGMGEVHLARDERLGRPVALKLLAPPLAADTLFRERLLRESRLAASLDHPNVIPVYEAGEDGGRLFIAMRFVDGPDLRSVLREVGALEPARALDLAAQVASALDAAHRRGLVHRDVKPSNVLLDQQDRREHAYLADFGLTRSASDEDPADGQLMGTIDYVAPEQVRGGEVDGRADQYALGCLLFECLTGTVPFPAQSDVAAIFAHLEEPPPSASARAPGLAPAVDVVLARGMAKNPADRFPTCSDLVDAARAALGIEPESQRRSRLIPVLAAAAVVIAALTAVLVLASRGGEASAQAPRGSLVGIDARTGRVTSRTTVPGYPNAVEGSVGGIWTADFRQGVLWRFDPGAGTLQRVPSNGEPRDIAALGPDVYVAADGNDVSGTVSRYDATTGVRRDSIDLLACAVGSGQGVVWAAGCPYVQRLSTGPRRLHVLRQRFLPFLAPATVSNSRVAFRELAVGAGSLWVLGDALDPRLWRLDPRTGRVLATIDLGFPPRSAAVADGFVWITDALHDTVVPVSAATNRVLAPVAVGAGAAGIAAADGSVWVASTVAGTVSRVDPSTRHVVSTTAVGGYPSELAGWRGTVWVTSHDP